MSSPLESPEFKNLYLGDIHDDDAQVIQSHLTPAPDGPPNTYKEPIPDQTVKLPIVLNRLITGYLLIQPSWTQPQQVLPSDMFRTQLMIKAISTTATDGILWSDQSNNLISPDGVLASGNAARLFPADGWVNLGPYTGALAASAFGAVGAVGFTWTSVTE